MDKRIGAQYYTLRKFCTTLEDFDETCRKVKEIGYKIVQLSGIGNFTGAEVKAVLDKHGLECVCTHRPFKRYLENLEEEIEFHKTIGCKILGLGAMPTPDAELETIETFVKDFKPVCERLAKEGLTFAYHNHAFEFERIDGVHAFDIITEKMAADNFKFILDAYWLAFAGLNPAKFIREHKGCIACVHFKDLKVFKALPRYAEIGQGNMDWDEIIAACEEAGVEYAVVEQDECDRDPFESIKMSYDYLTTKGFN